MITEKDLNLDDITKCATPPTDELLIKAHKEAKKKLRKEIWKLVNAILNLGVEVAIVVIVWKSYGTIPGVLSLLGLSFLLALAERIKNK